MKSIKYFLTYFALIFIYKHFKEAWKVPHKQRPDAVIAIIANLIHKDIKK